MSESFERVVDRICLERGWVTQEQVVDCLLHHKSRGADPAATRLSDILVERGLVDHARMEALRREVTELTPPLPGPDLARREDRALGRALVSAGLASEGQVADILAHQERRAAQGLPLPRMALALLEQGRVRLAAIQEALAALRARAADSPGSPPELSKDADHASREKAPAPSNASSRLPEEVRRAAVSARNRVGKYVIVGKAGSGGMGTVQKAWDTVLHRWVALKSLDGEIDDSDRARFRIEAETIAALRHPNIVGIYDVLGEGDHLTLVMEFVDGVALSRRRFPPREAARILAEAARAIEYAHSQGVLHRDITPSNILLDRGGKPFLTDFGVAKRMGGASLTTFGTILGTPSYMAPERVEGDPAEVDVRADIYSLGAVLYELLTGQPPFNGVDEFATLQKVIQDPVLPPSKLRPEVPPALEAIVLRCMDKEKLGRYPSAKALADDLERFVAGTFHGEPIPQRRQIG